LIPPPCGAKLASTKEKLASTQEMGGPCEMRKALVLTAVSLVALSACSKKPDQTPPRTPPPPDSKPHVATPASGAPTAGTTAAAPVSMPARTPGLWEQKVSSRGRTQVSRICLDKAVEQRFTVWGQNAGRGACGHIRITPRVGGGWDFTSSCDTGETGRTVTRGEATGDFAKAYKVSAESRISGARAPEMNGTHAMTLEASWQGPCPAGMRPGDMLLPGGLKINMMQIPTR
jgi:hypothetical protein